jgi:hypothetical protein
MINLTQFPGWELHMLQRGKREEVLFGVSTGEMPEAEAICAALNRAADAEVKPSTIILGGRVICTISEEEAGYVYMLPQDIRHVLRKAGLLPWRKVVNSY